MTTARLRRSRWPHCLPSRRFWWKKTKNGPAQVDIRPLIRELTVQPCADGLLLQALLCAQNPGLNPELLTAALRAHLPACAPDFARVMRLEILDAAGEPFR